MARNYENKANNSRQNLTAASFGEILRSNRQKHGISLSEVSEDLRVREDILAAIEDGDFSKIPPQGYSRNMIKSYARLLGLNTNKITEMFLDAEYSFQLGKRRESVQKISNENKKRVPNNRSFSSYKTPRQQIENSKVYKDNTNDKKFDNVGFGGRTVHVFGKKYKNSPRSRSELDIENRPSNLKNRYQNNTDISNDLLNGNNYNSAKERLENRRRKNNNISGRKKFSRYDSYQLTEEENPNSIRNNNPQKQNSYNFMNIYHKTDNNNLSQSKMMFPIIAGIVIVLIVVLVLIFFFVGKQQENDKTDVSKLNVVGISDVENPNKKDKDSEQPEKEVVAEPKEVEFKYKVKDNKTVYIEIYEANSTKPTLAREVKSGESNSFKVTDTLQFVTSGPENVEIYVDNELVTPTENKNTGVYNYKLVFKDWLTNWKTKHKTTN